MNITRLASSRNLVALAGLVLFGACGGGGSGGSATASGSINFVADMPVTIDQEPNDSVDQTQLVGELAAGRALTIRGSVGDGDPFDAFTFVVPARVRVQAHLVQRDAPAGRVELASFDPVAMRPLQRIEGDARFHAKGAFDLVVRRVEGAGSYDLVVRAAPIAPEIVEPGALGVFSLGDEIKLRAAAGASFTFTSAEEQRLDVECPGATLKLRDAAGVVVADVVDRGSATLVALQAVFVDVLRAEGPTRIQLKSNAPPPSLAPRTPARIVSLARELDTWRAAPDVPLYGRPLLQARAGEVLVRPREGATIAGELARRSLVEKDRLPGDAVLTSFEMPSGLDDVERARTTLAFVRSLAGVASVEYAELNLLRTKQGVFTPNDPFFSTQWHYPLIRVPDAWGEGVTGVDVVVAVIDTGRRAHSDLDANTLDGFDFISDAGNADDGDGVDGDETDEGDGSAQVPSSFHGTHVAGTIAAVTDNNQGVAGVAFDARVRHLRALGQDGGSDFDIARAVRWAAGINVGGGIPTLADKVDVINMSLGGPGSTSTGQSAVTAARNAGVVICAAAGNNNSGTAFFPAAYNGVISVSAVDLNSQKAPYSNFHASVDVCAPGGDTGVNLNGDAYVDGVLSTLVSEPGFTEIYAFYQGTSMACPHVAGVAALIKSANPALTPAEIEGILTGTAVDLGTAGDDVFFGFGLIDALACVQAAVGGTSGTPVLALSPASLSFGADETNLSVGVANIGGGLLDVTTVVSSQTWLTVTPVASTSASTDTASITCVVDRTGLANGSYSASITVDTSNGGSGVVGVSMTVAPPPVVVDIELFVLALDVDTFETEGQAVLNPASFGLDFFIDTGFDENGEPTPTFPAGDYYFICGSDDDNDGFICGDGDTYCGLFPTLNEPEIVTASGNTSGIDFVVGPASSTTASENGRRRGFRRYR